METVIVIDVLGAHDRLRSRHRIERPGEAASCTIGRGVAADVVLDDPHIAAVHARVTVDAAGRATITDLDSVNGIEIGGRRLHGVLDVPLLDGVFRIGRTRLRLRTATETIPAEVSDEKLSPAKTRARDLRWLAIGLVVATAGLVFSIWTMTLQTRELPTTMLTALVVLAAIFGVWIALWALVSRVAFGESRWLRHAAIFFCVVAAIDVGLLLIDIVSGAVGIYLPSSAEMWIAGALIAVALSIHLVNASTMRPRVAVAIGVLIPAIVLGLTQWTAIHGQNRSASYIPDRNKIVPPVLMLRGGKPLEKFAVSLGELKGQADAKRAFVETEDPSPDDDSSDD
jgi:hypothetical protein